MTPPVISAESIVVRRSGRPILHDAYVDVTAGAITALVGRNGAGKSTLISVVVGRRRPDRGQVRWDGALVESPSLARLAGRGLSFLPDRAWLPPGFTVAATLSLAAGAGAWREVASSVGVAEWGSRRIGTLSGGERRLTELAFALLCRPRALVLDEPYRDLEPRHRERLAQLLRRLTGEGTAVLFADHDAALVRAHADRVFSIENGRTRLVSEFQHRPIEEWYHEWPR